METLKTPEKNAQEVIQETNESYNVFMKKFFDALNDLDKKNTLQEKLGDVVSDEKSKTYYSNKDNMEGSLYTEFKSGANNYELRNRWGGDVYLMLRVLKEKQNDGEGKNYFDEPEEYVFRKSNPGSEKLEPQRGFTSNEAQIKSVLSKIQEGLKTTNELLDQYL